MYLVLCVLSQAITSEHWETATVFLTQSKAFNNIFFFYMFIIMYTKQFYKNVFI